MVADDLDLAAEPLFQNGRFEMTCFGQVAHRGLRRISRAVEMEPKLVAHIQSFVYRGRTFRGEGVIQVRPKEDEVGRHYPGFSLDLGDARGRLEIEVDVVAHQ